MSTSSAAHPQLTQTFIDTAPNAAKTIQSLRHLNYNDISACLDIADNSIDARCESVWFEITGTGKGRHDYITRIIIADNGHGMDRATLGQALRLGSDTPKDIKTDLGVHGMGLCTASLSICRRTTVLTQTAKGQLLKGINDVDIVMRLNQFKSYLDVADQDDRRLFERFLDGSPSGTLVILDNLDGLQTRSVEAFCNKLTSEAGRIYRYFINAERSFFVNGSKVSMTDPLKWDDSSTVHYDDSVLDIKYPGEADETLTEPVPIRIALLGEQPADGEVSDKQNMKTQGIYIVRNNREIATAETLGFFQKHNSYNRFRCEIRMSGVLDRAMKVGVKKHGIDPVQSVSDQLSEYLRPQITSIGKQTSRKQKANAGPELSAIHEAAADEIRNKSKLLVATEADGIADEDKSKGAPRKPGAKSATRPAGSAPKTTRPQLTDKARFETVQMGEGGPIFDCKKQGSTVIVELNSDHAFYRRFVLDNLDSAQQKRIVAGVDYLLFCWAASELKYREVSEDVEDMLLCMKADVSNNLRILLR